MANVIGFLKSAYAFLAAGLSVAGPPGNLAASLLGNVLKVDGKPTPATIAKALETAVLTPDQQLAMQTAEQQYKAQMNAAGFEHAEQILALENADRADARAMEVKTGDRWTPRILAAAITIGFFALLFYIVRCGLPANGHDALVLLLGSLSTAWIAVVTFY